MPKRSQKSAVVGAAERAASSVVQAFADGAIVYLRSDLAPGWLVPVAVRHRDEARDVRLREIAAAPVSVEPSLQGAALAALAPVAVDPRDVEKLGRDVASFASAMSSFVLAPLAGRRRPLGVILAMRDADHPPFVTQDRFLCATLATAAAKSIEAAIEGREPAEPGLDVARAVDDLASALSIALTEDQVASVSTAIVARAFDAELVEIVVADPAPRVVATTSSDAANAPDVRASAAFVVLEGGDAVFDSSASSWRGHFPREAALTSGPGSLASVPLLAANRVHGALTVVASESAAFVSEARALLRTMAKHAALALARAKLDETERRTQERWALLAEAGKATVTLDARAVAAAVTGLMVPRFADGCAIDLVVDDALTRVASSGSSLPERTSRPLRSERCVRIPLHGYEQTLGALVLVRDEARAPFDDDDDAFVEELAHRCALALDNARLYEQTRRAVAARDEFLAIAGHELRTPLSTLNMFVWSLVGQKKTGLRGMQEELALRQITRLDRLVDQLLDVSRVTSGRLVLERERVSIADVIDVIVSELSTQVEDASMISVDLDRTIVGDFDRLRVEQIVTNLVSNAIRYGEHAKIAVSAKRVGAAVRIVVRDEGPGMPPDVRARIFDRDARLVSKRPNEGLGLGLWITRQLVEAHGGTIDVQSEAGHGVEVTVELPLAANETAAVVPPLH